MTDKRKEKITIGHLLSMTSGIPGENELVFGIPPLDNFGPFEHALGYQENRYGYKTDQLISEPGTIWDYSDPAMAHLSILFKLIMRREMHEYMQEKVFDKIGIENASWDVHGGGQFIGPHTSAHVGLHISARELARVGYLLMQNGRWADDEVVPSSWIEKATKPSQTLNPEYGFTFWVNTDGTRWPGLPVDMFSLEGYNTNRCYVIPSKELVVVRVGSGPNQWNEQLFIKQVLKAIN
jgi:CubicO group peptidase (beta-lactamase class C family)